MSEQTIEYRGSEVFLRREGSGDPLLFLHSEGGGKPWAVFHEALASRFDLIAPDLPGFSRSPRPEWLDGIDDLVYFCLELMDNLGIESLPVVGESLGGWLAAEVAAHHPERVERLALLAPIGLEILEERYADIFSMNPHELAEVLFHDPARAREFFPADPDLEFIAEAYSDRTTFARLCWTTSYTNPKLGERLYRVKAPTLLLWGDSDGIVPIAYAERWRELLPDAELKVIERCGHAVTLDCGEKAAELVTSFLASGMAAPTEGGSR